jgi:hypothetical protein
MNAAMPPMGEGTAAVTGGYEQVVISRIIDAVILTAERSGGTKSGLVPKSLDDAEQIVQAPGVELGCVVSQLEKDLLHHEGGRDCLDEQGGANRSHPH